MSERAYTVEIIESSREFSNKERVNFKNMSDFVKLDDIAPCEIDVQDYVALKIHNDRAKDNKDYNKYVIISKDGTHYVTGSPSFWETFCDIMDDMASETEEWKLRVIKRDSKNREGKYFLTCCVV